MVCTLFWVILIKGFSVALVFHYKHVFFTYIHIYWWLIHSEYWIKYLPAIWSNLRTIEEQARTQLFLNPLSWLPLPRCFSNTSTNMQKSRKLLPTRKTQNLMLHVRPCYWFTLHLQYELTGFTNHLAQYFACTTLARAKQKSGKWVI